MVLKATFMKAEATYREAVLEDTWGHLAPRKNKSYKGRVVFAVGCFGSDYLNPTTLVSEFGDLDSSPWFYSTLMKFLEAHPTEPGCVYEWKGTFRNYRFMGGVNLLLNANADKRRTT